VVLSIHHTTTHTPSLASNASRRGGFLVFFHHTTTHPSSLASNASWRGFLVSTHPVPPPSLQMQVGGGVFSLHPPHHTTIHTPSLASNASQRGRFLVFPHHATTHPPSLASNASQRGFLVSTHPVPPPSLQMRVRGGVSSPHHHPFPLPRFKCKSVGVFSVHTTTHYPSLTSNASRRGCFQSSSTTPPPIPSPLLQMQVGGGGF
jgi:hypothetical protein